MAVSQVRAANTYLQTAGEVPGRSVNNQEIERQAAREQRRQDADAGPAVVTDLSDEARESARVEQDLAREGAVQEQERRQSSRIDAYV